MIRAFLDASALFAGVCSVSGGAHALLEMADSGRVALVVSEDIVEETVRNIRRKVPRAADSLERVLTRGPLEYVEPFPEELERAVTVTVAKDVPVVAGALSSGAKYLVSHDHRHLVGNAAIEKATGIKVVTPGDLLAIIRLDEAHKDQIEDSTEETPNSEITQ